MKSFFKKFLIVFPASTLLFFNLSCRHTLNGKHTALVPPEKQISVLNTIIKDIPFFPLNGLRFRMSELKNIKAIVFVMREKDCPISEKYGARLTQLEKQYSKQGIKFVYIYVGQVNRLESAKSDLEKFGFKSPYIIDTKQRIINALSAQTTGDIFVLTPERKVIYRGPVDDQYHILQQAPKAKNHYLSDVLQNVVSGKKVIPKELSAPGCFISRPLVKEKVFYKDVAPIISKRCTVCHNPTGTGPMNFVKYEDIVGRRKMFQFVLENDLMPPWYVDPNTGPWMDDLSLTPKEKAMLLKWAYGGYLKDEEKTKPLWKKEKVSEIPYEHIIRLPKKMVIPSRESKVEMFSDYKTVVIPTNFKEDKWIKDIKIILKPKVVHHLLFWVMDPKFSANNDLQTTPFEEVVKNAVSFFGARKIPKFDYNIFENFKSIGSFLPKNAKIVLKIHYENIGKEITDDYTHIKLNFHKKKPKYKLVLHTLDQHSINIPPHESNYESSLFYKVKDTMHLIAVYLHMHYRGKASSMFVINPKKGIKKRIFGLDPFTIKFTGIYGFKEPITVQKDSSLGCINWFDNSANNKQILDPSIRVLHGPSSNHEMSMCYFIGLVPIDSKAESHIWHIY